MYERESSLTREEAPRNLRLNEACREASLWLMISGSVEARSALSTRWKMCFESQIWIQVYLCFVWVLFYVSISVVLIWEEGGAERNGKMWGGISINSSIFHVSRALRPRMNVCLIKIEDWWGYTFGGKSFQCLHAHETEDEIKGFQREIPCDQRSVMDE